MDRPAGSPVAVKVSFAAAVLTASTGRDTLAPTRLLMPCGLATITEPLRLGVPETLLRSVFVTLSEPLSGRFREESPTRIRYAPGVVVHPPAVSSQCARSCAVRVKRTVWLWPGCS